MFVPLLEKVASDVARRVFHIGYTRHVLGSSLIEFFRLQFIVIHVSMVFVSTADNLDLRT